MVMSNDIKIKAAENRYQTSIDKYMAESADSDRIGGGASQIESKLRLKQLEEEMDEAYSELKRLRQLDTPTNIFYRESRGNWKEKLPKIDFARANTIVNDILEKYKQKQGVALFLLQNSSEMGGEWLLQEIESKLKGMGNYISPCEVRFPHHISITELEFIRILAEKYDIDVSSDSIDRIVEQAIDKICKSFYPGSIWLISIELRRIETENHFLKWFICKFWEEFTSKLEQIGQNCPLVRVMAVLSIEKGNIPKNYLPDSQYCTKTNFDGRKILKLPLPPWKKEDIKTWLILYSGLVKPPIEMPNYKIERIANSIYEQTKGKPREVYRELEREIDTILSVITG